MPRVSLLELPARWGARRAQVALARRLVQPGSTDLVLLPEATFTGYVSPELQFDLTPVAEPLTRGVRRLASLARTWGCDVVGPVIERDGARCFNSLVGVDAAGTPWLHYRKRHPWHPETWATPGDLPWPLVQWRGFVVTCALCFDVHFLAEEAAEVLEQADLLLFASAWVDRNDTRPGLVAGLAARFGLTVLNPNWGLGEPPLWGQGRSLVVRPDGTRTVLARGLRLDVEL